MAQRSALLKLHRQFDCPAKIARVVRGGSEALSIDCVAYNAETANITEDIPI